MMYYDFSIVRKTIVKQSRSVIMIDRWFLWQLHMIGDIQYNAK
jgi:hypothetical protein